MDLLKQIKTFDETSLNKLNIILNDIIDTIEVNDSNVFIKTKKNIIVQNNGSLIQINNGVHVMISKEIHLNPNIITPNSINVFDTLQQNLEEAEAKEKEKMSEQIVCKLPQTL